MVEDRFLLHAHDKNNWRLRNVKEHPLDPGWEVGRYCCCHPGVRACIKEKARIFDMVVRDGKGVIRSAFIIRRAKGEGKSRVLYFDDFYFAVGEPIELPGPYIQYRQMKMSTWINKYPEHRTPPLWQKITTTKEYRSYKKGQRPKINQSSWESCWSKMVDRASLIRKGKGYESNGSACRSECK